MQHNIILEVTLGWGGGVCKGLPIIGPKTGSCDKWNLSQRGHSQGLCCLDGRQGIQETSGGRGNQAELSWAPKKQEMMLWALGLFRIWEVFESKTPLETDFWLSHKTMRFSVWALRK